KERGGALRMQVPAGTVGPVFIRGEQLMTGKVIVVLVEAGIYFGITSFNNRLLIRSNDNKFTIQIFGKFHCSFLCRISDDVLERTCYPLNYFSCCRSTQPQLQTKRTTPLPPTPNTGISGLIG